MAFVTQLGALVMVPFMMFSSWFGFGHFNHQATSSDGHESSQEATSTWGDSDATSTVMNPGDNGTDIGFMHQNQNKHGHATTTPSSVLQITGESPTSGSIGTNVTLTGKGFTSDSLVRFGIGTVKSTSVSADGTSLSFTIPSAIGPYCQKGMMCPMFMEQIVQNRSYPVLVQNDSTSTDSKFQSSNSVNFTVTGPIATTAHEINLNFISNINE